MIFDELEIKEIEKSLGLSFADWNLVTTAFLHKSYLNENRLDGKWVDWDRLFFLGQELFKLIIADLGLSYVNQNRGYISNLHSEILNNQFRERILEHYCCYHFVKRGKGSMADAIRPETLLQPILAVIYLEHGYERTQKWVKPVYLQLIKEYQETPNIDWKTSLQQWVQSKKEKLQYSIIGEEGLDHQKIHIVELNALNRKTTGKGKKKKDAEVAAAKQFHIQFIPKSYWHKNIEFNPFVEPKINLPFKRIRELKQVSKFFTATPELLHQSLTHSSFLNENKHLKLVDYGSLAYLGSWVYGFLYTSLIYKHFYKLNLESVKDATELYGYIHSNHETINLIHSLGLPLEELIWTGKGQRKLGIQDSMKVEAFQAFIGARFISSRLRDGRVSLTELEEMLESWLFTVHEKYSVEEIHPTTGFQQIVQQISSDWETRFETVTVRQTHEPEIQGIVKILHKGKEILEWREVSSSGIEARNAAARLAIKEVKSAIDLQSARNISKKLEPFANEFFTLFRETPRQSKRIKKLTQQCGGLGVNHIVHNRFVDGYQSIKNSIDNGMQKGIKLDEEFLLKVYQNHKTDLKLNQINFMHMNDYIHDLTEWLQDLDLHSNPFEIDRFFDDIVESIQIFRHIVDEHMNEISLDQSIEELLLVKPRGMEIDLKKETHATIYGNDSFLKWFFYNVLIKLEASRVDTGSTLPLEITISERQRNRSITDVIIHFDAEKLEVEALQKSLKNIVQFSSVCFVQTYFEDQFIKFSFVNPFGDSGSRKQVSALFQWLSAIQIEHIRELSPIGGIIHDLKNALVILKRHLIMAKKKNKLNIDILSIRESCLTKVNALRSFFSINKANYSHVNLLEFSSVLSKELNTLASGRCNLRFSTGFESHEVITDSAFLHSIITNLVKNAIECVKQPTGQVKLTMRMDYQDELLIRVEDNGCGISPEQLANLFTSFNSNKESIKGTGLGLPTVKRYVDILGGLIEVTSKVNVGTTFEILIPLEVRELIMAG